MPRGGGAGRDTDGSAPAGGTVLVVLVVIVAPPLPARRRRSSSGYHPPTLRWRHPPAPPSIQHPASSGSYQHSR